MEEKTIELEVLIEIVRPTEEEQKEEVCKYKGLINAHTHGLEKVNLPNLCLGVDIGDEKIEQILNTVTDIVLNPDENSDILVTHIVTDKDGSAMFSFKLIPATSYDEDVLLIVLADKNGKFPWEDGCKRPYKYQINNHHNIEILRG